MKKVFLFVILIFLAVMTIAVISQFYAPQMATRVFQIIWMFRNLLENRAVSKIALISWCVLIFIFSNIPNLKSGLEEDFLLRKIAHGFEYSVLALLMYRVLRQYNFFGFYLFVVTFLASFSYALTDEIHQTFVFGRSGNFFDVGVDAGGILLTLGLLIIYRLKKTKYG